MKMIDQLNEGIKEAMRSRNQIRLNTLRMLKSKILAVDARGNLPESEITKLFKTYYGNLQEAHKHAQDANRPEMIAQLEAELVIIQEFLPQAPSEEETKRIIVQAIAESGAKTKKDLGLVMKAARKLHAGIDGKMAKELADQLLD